MATLMNSLRRSTLPNIYTTSLERRHFEKIINRLEQLQRLCTLPDFDLPKTAPNINSILVDLISFISYILKHNSGSRFSALSKNTYLIAFIQNLEEKIKSFTKNLNDNKSDIKVPGSAARKKTVSTIVRFTYLFHQLQWFFPSGEYRVCLNFQKVEAQRWWLEHMSGKVFASLDEFLEPFCATFDITGAIKRHKLINEVNTCRFKYISAFEFDVFTRLFSPWSKLSQIWHDLTVLHPGYLSCATYEDVRHFLETKKDLPGTYVFRMSCTSLGFWSIGYVKENGEVAQTVVKHKSIIDALIDGKNKES